MVPALSWLGKQSAGFTSTRRFCWKVLVAETTWSAFCRELIHLQFCSCVLRLVQFWSWPKVLSLRTWISKDTTANWRKLLSAWPCKSRTSFNSADHRKKCEDKLWGSLINVRCCQDSNWDTIVDYRGQGVREITKFSLQPQITICLHTCCVLSRGCLMRSHTINDMWITITGQSLVNRSNCRSTAI